jgi:hypothetical protein
MRIFKRDLTHYFLREHDQLPPAYLASCKKFFKELSTKQQALKRQATSATSWSHCGSLVSGLKIDLTERYNYEYTRSFKNSRGLEQTLKDAGLGLWYTGGRM